MKTILAISLALFSCTSMAQTDIIEMRSRNASLKNYKRVSNSTRNDHVASNFGMRRDESVVNAVLDSVVCISNEKAIMYTSLWRYRAAQPALGRTKVLSAYMEYVKKKNGPKSVNASVSPWSPGVDTVIFHPLFSRQHSLDSIKMILDREYFFQNSSDSVKFVGYDNADSLSTQDEVQPVKHKRKKKQNSFGWELIFMLVTPILFMLAVNKITLFRTS